MAIGKDMTLGRSMSTRRDMAIERGMSTRRDMASARDKVLVKCTVIWNIAKGEMAGDS